MTEPSQAVPVVPQNLDAEEHVLGAMLLSPAAIDAVRQVLDPADFYRESHARIYRAALSLHALGQPVDGITVADRLRELEQLADSGGPERVHELAALTPSTANVAHHARLIVKEARRRELLRAADLLRTGAHAGADPAKLTDQALELLHDDRARTAPAPLVTNLAEFVDELEEHAEPLAGDAENTLLPAGGLLIVGGEGGASKTTLTLDAVAHLASGTPWMGYPTGRPLRVLIIENEGPRPQFRAKLAAKVASWDGAPFAPNVHVWEEPWAQFNFSRDTDRQQLRDTARELALDLVVADPLDSLGVVGAGTPEDVRIFVAWLKDCGLHNPEQPLAYWLLHHFNKTGGRSVVAQLSGAWGGHPDAILGVELGDGQTTKLTWGKLRHATPPASKTVVLRWNLETRGFEALEQHRTDDVGELRAAILEHVTAHPGQRRGIAEDAVYQARKDAHGATRDAVRAAVDYLTDEHRESHELEVRGGPNNAKLLYPASLQGSRLAEPLFREPANHDAPGGSRLADGPSRTREPHLADHDHARFAEEPPLPKGRGSDGEPREPTSDTGSRTLANDPDDEPGPAAGTW